MQANGLPDTPLDPVAHHRLADGAGYSETNAGPIGLGFAETESREERAGKTGPLVIDSPEISRSQQTDTFRKT